MKVALKILRWKLMPAHKNRQDYFFEMIMRCVYGRILLCISPEAFQMFIEDLNNPERQRFFSLNSRLTKTETYWSSTAFSWPLRDTLVELGDEVSSQNSYFFDAVCASRVDICTAIIWWYLSEPQASNLCSIPHCKKGNIQSLVIFD